MQISAVVAMAVLVGSGTACFITNCPPGGKRSSPSAQLGSVRTCAQCGPGLQGRCVGPDICCGPEIGCYLGTREAILCRSENLVPVTCSNDDLKTCGRQREGRCASSGVCCTEVKCEFDVDCVIEGVDRHRYSLLETLSDAQWRI
ncbi:oxytocin-neurophysin 1-like isoform X2 [Penaeus japonicus]|nr:oxytocin-neurophysin 1-like isoform X2 [Penaeus japonicus]